MEFGLSETQTTFQEQVHRFLDSEVPLERVRKFADSLDLIDKKIWSGFGELGLYGMLIPEEFGGVGMSALDAAVVSECLGSRVTPVPFLACCVLAPTAIRLAGTDEQKNKYLKDIAAGTVIFGAALSELTGARDDAHIDFSDGEISGTAMFAMDPGCDYILVADRNRRLHIVASDAAGITTKIQPTIDCTRLIQALEFDKVEVDTLPGSNGSNIALQLIDLGRVMLAADTLGAAQSMLDKAVAHAMQREQFNRVIASFQAIKHMCAEMAAEIEPSRSLVWYAAHALDELPNEARLAACHAKAHLSEVGTFIARTATVVHGGMGFTDLLGLHYWFKRIGYNRQMLGGPERVREEAAALQGLTLTTT